MTTTPFMSTHPRMPHPIPLCGWPECEAVSTSYVRNPDDPQHVESLCADHKQMLRREGWS